MSNPKTLTIAISAYNEEKNIPMLLRDIERQKFHSLDLEKILIISDGSTDRTVTVSKISSILPIQVINHKERKGLAHRLNEICSLISTDVLVILNADIRLQDQLCIQSLVRPITSGQADLTSCRIDALNGNSLFERALKTSMNIKNIVFEEYKHADNVYSCHGTARAFSKDLYTAIQFPHSVGEDAYSYVYASYHHFPYVYVRSTSIHYKLPKSLADHKKQSLRYVQSKRQFVKEFGELYMRKMYYLPQSLLIQSMLRYCIKNPIEVMIYGVVFLSIRLQSFRFHTISNTWDVVSSSK